MKIIQKKIKDLIPAEYNPRKIEKEALEQLKTSLESFDCVEPAVVNIHPDRVNIIVGGHQRIKAAKALKWKDFPCVEVNLPIEKEKELNIRLNKNTGEFDFELLETNFDLEDLMEWGFDEDDFGIEPEEIGELEGEDDVPEAPVTPITVLGDIWILGEHRLVCGDSTNITDVDKLMDGNKADMVFTDPPYNVAIKGKFTGAIKNDDLSDADFQDLLNGAATTISQFNKGSSYIAYEIKNHAQFEGAFSAVGEIDEIIIWNKDSASFYNNDKYNRKFEAILFIQGGGKLRCKAEVNVWDFAKSSSFNSRDENGKRFNEKGNFLVAHPTTKPVGLVERAISNSSKKGHSILDLFGGSGSTLIACEKTKRKCFMMELDEKYCDVIIKRWQEFTGKEAVNEKGATYNQLYNEQNKED